MAGLQEKGVREEDQKLVKKIKNYIYDPAQIIGSGFSSNVYKGLNELNGETIAIKVLELSKIQSEVEKYLLNNQINALRALSHPHILRTVEILMTKNNVYIMTEFCQNGDLQQHVRKQGRLNQLEALHIIKDVAEGYLAIEEKQIVHRDLKTANIFLTSKGARIADFGFCQFINETKKPQMFYNVGSPAYMSPESYRDNVYTSKSDVWSMGIIFFEMLVGETPDKNLSYSQMSGNLMAGRVSSGNNEEIRRILSGCFKRDLNERSSPSQFLDAISHEIVRLQGRRTSGSTNSVIRSAFGGDMSPNRQQSRNMIPVNSVGQHNSAGRSQSPFKTRFVNNLGQEQSSSPMKSTRQRDQSPHRVSVREINKLKHMTEMLLFLFRTLNFLGETDLERANFMRLILFRHRNHLQSLVEKQMTAQKLDRSTYEPFKEFQYLKSRFDEAYLHKESQPSLHRPPTQILSKLNELSNQYFTDIKSLVTYCGLLVDASRQCERLINSGLELGRASKIAVVWDYLMIHFEMLEQYSEGQTMQRISQQVFGLTGILRDQPRKMGSRHFQLLGLKLQMINQFYESWSGEVPDRRSQERVSNEPRILMQNGFF